MSIPDALLPRWIELLGRPEWGLAEAPAEPARPEGGARRCAWSSASTDPPPPRRPRRTSIASSGSTARPRTFPARDLPATEARGLRLVDALVAVGFATSRSEARRLVGQGGVRVDEERAERTSKRGSRRATICCKPGSAASYELASSDLTAADFIDDSRGLTGRTTWHKVRPLSTRPGYAARVALGAPLPRPPSVFEKRIVRGPWSPSSPASEETDEFGFSSILRQISESHSAACSMTLVFSFQITGEFDPGSERTLAACLTHASRARKSLRWRVKRRTGE